MVQVIYKAASTTKSKLKIDVTSNEFTSSLTAPNNPTPATDPLYDTAGATKLTVFAATSLLTLIQFM